MDIRLLLATEPSLSHEDRTARNKAIRSPSLDTTPSSSTTAATPNNVPLRRDAARVLQGVFDTGSNPSSRSASPAVPPPVRTATADTQLSTTPMLPVYAHKRPQRVTSKPSYGPATCSVQPHVLKSLPTASSSAAGPPIGSSFSYTPLPEDYCYREAEFDYAAAQDYMDSVPSDTDTEPEEPETPPLDYIGMGTPIITPRLMAKVLQAKQAGKSLAVNGSHLPVRRLKTKKSKKVSRKGEDGKGKGKHKSGTKTKTFGERDGSPAPSASSTGLSRKFSQSYIGNKRPREDDEISGRGLDKRQRGPSSEASSTPTATNSTGPKRSKGPKGWKGWALIEVSSSEDERPATNLYDEEGRRIKSKSVEVESVDEESSTDSEMEKAKTKPGWKGWALVKNPPDRSKLIKLDAPPMVLTTRSTRSGRAFGEKNFDEKIMAGGRPVAPSNASQPASRSGSVATAGTGVASANGNASDALKRRGSRFNHKNKP